MSMFGSNELAFYLKASNDEFVLVIQDEHKDVTLTTVNNVRAATLFDKVMVETLKDCGVDEPSPEKYEKIYTSSLKWLYYCAIEDLAEAKANPRPTYSVIDEIIALEARIPKMEEMIAERVTVAKLLEPIIVLGVNIRDLDGFDCEIKVINANFESICDYIQVICSNKIEAELVTLKFRMDSEAEVKQWFTFMNVFEIKNDPRKGYNQKLKLKIGGNK